MGLAPDEPDDALEPCASLRPSMSRRSLRPQLNQIRGWVRQGRTDAWIAHQLEVTVQQIQSFKRENELEADAGQRRGRRGGGPARGRRRAIAAELEAEAARRAEEEASAAEEAARKAAEEEERQRCSLRRRGRRSSQAQARAAAPRWALPPPRRRQEGPLEGTFDHGEEGYGLWLDPAVQDDPIYAEHWAGHRPVEITIEEDQIVIRRASGGEDEETTDARAAAIAWRHAQDALQCEIVEPWEHGMALRTPSAPNSGTRTASASRVTRAR